MLLPILLLPVAAVLINDAKTEYVNNTLIIDITTAEPVTREDVRSVTGGPHRLYVYLNDTATARREFGSGQDAILVHPRIRYTKLEIPTPSHCAEPVAIEQTTHGIRVRASCRGAEATASGAAPPLRVREASPTRKPEPEPTGAALLRDKGQSEVLRAALALPPEPSDHEGRAASAKLGGEGGDQADRAVPASKAPVAGTVEGPIVPAGAKLQAATQAPVAPPQPEAPRAAVAATETVNNAKANGSTVTSSGGSSFASMLLAVLLLAGLGVGAVVFGRRHVKRNRLIRIVETASIGPRRSLVVACIGGRTMVLGVSEAGVSLLDAQGSSAVMPEVATKTQSSSLEEAVAGLRHLAPAAINNNDEVVETKNESSLLSRLFQKTKRSSRSDFDGTQFDGLLAESLEDEDLRRKLALGEAGRVA